MRAVLWGFLFLAVAGFAVSFSVEASLHAKAELIQIVRRKPVEAGRLEDAFRPLGPPEEMTISDPGAFLPGVGEKGARLADANYLEKHGVAPLPFGVVARTIALARLGAIAAAVLMIVGLVWIHRSNRGPFLVDPEWLERGS